MIHVPPLVKNTPLENHLSTYGLLVKREDLCAPAPWPPFSKTRGVLSWMEKRVAEGWKRFGVLDTYHSQGGLAVSAAGARLGVDVLNYFPVYASERDTGVDFLWPKQLRWQQQEAFNLGSTLKALPAGRSAVLYHQAKSDCEKLGGIMYPNALKLQESVDETASEVMYSLHSVSDGIYQKMKQLPWIVPASSGTLAAGVLAGLEAAWWDADLPELIIHMGYDRPTDAVKKYVTKMAGVSEGRARITVIQEGYQYKDKSRQFIELPFPANPYYDMKAMAWWMREGRSQFGEAVFWLIG